MDAASVAQLTGLSRATVDPLHKKLSGPEMERAISDFYDGCGALKEAAAREEWTESIRSRGQKKVRAGHWIPAPPPRRPPRRARPPRWLCCWRRAALPLMACRPPAAPADGRRRAVEQG